jgi:hypothetical protein
VTFTTGFPGLPAAGRPQAGDARQRAHEFRARLRRTAQLRKAAEVVPQLPPEGCSLHTLLTGYFDPILVATCVLKSRPVVCGHCRLATLSFGSKNVQEMAGWLDSGAVRRLTLLCANFMEKASPKEYGAAVAELVERRGQAVGSARTHTKLVTLAWEDGLRLSFEGSANLRSSRNAENLTIVNDPGVHDFWADFIDRKVREHEVQ